MKVAIAAESAIDEQALRQIVNAALGHATTQPSPPFRLRDGGVHALLNRDLTPLLRHYHYQTDADAVVVVIDSDNKLIHCDEHDLHPPVPGACRFCDAVRTTQKVLSQLRQPEHRIGPLKFAVGLAVPLIEAWYRCLDDHRIDEFAWQRFLDGQPKPFEPSAIKPAVYGNGFRSLTHDERIEIAVTHAARVVAEIEKVERRFPNGFGRLLRDLRNW